MVGHFLAAKRAKSAKWRADQYVVASLHAQRSELIAALDLLFAGI